MCRSRTRRSRRPAGPTRPGIAARSDQGCQCACSYRSSDAPHRVLARFDQTTGRMAKRSGEPSTLGYALLGLIARRARTGYELAQLMNVPIGFMWRARHSQIYPLLARLEAAGLVRHTLVRQTERPDKKTYRITAAGRAALRSWISSPLDESAPRDEFSLRVFSMWVAPKPKAVSLLKAELARHKALLRRHEEVEVAARRHLSLRGRAGAMHFANYAT